MYPKDKTPGGNAESCHLRDNYDNLKAKGFEVVGVSPDSEKSHDNLKNKHDLPFALVLSAKPTFSNEVTENNIPLWAIVEMEIRSVMPANDQILWDSKPSTFLGGVIYEDEAYWESNRGNRGGF